MKHYFLKILFVVLLTGITTISKAQEEGDSIFVHRHQPKLCYNAVKMGFLFSKLTLAYERAIIPFVSIGASADGHPFRFTGYSGNLFVRAYSHGFHRFSLYVEAKGTYGRYNPECYSTLTNGVLYGEHKADITGISFTGSLGYRFVLGSGFMIETAVGLRASNGNFGTDDNYFKSKNIYGDYLRVDRIFYGVGPGGPVEFTFNLGYCF